jgi:two-component system sensor histidine kinase HydH
MNRKILIRAAAPAVLVGGLLCAACLVSIWVITRLQADMSQVISGNVASMEAGQNLEVTAHRLRFRWFQYLTHPTPAKLEYMKEISAEFEQTLALVRERADNPQELRLSQDIEDGYRNYRQEMEQLIKAGEANMSVTDLQALADRQLIQLVTVPCERLSQANKEMMTATVRENDQLSSRISLALLLIGLGGPIGGLLGGFGVARGFSRTIHQLSIHVRDITHRLEENVGSVRVVTDGDPDQLDQQLQKVVNRVEEVTERLQRQQREMLRAQQLSAVGQLAASVAHEIRNPLTAVKLLVEAGLRANNRKLLTLEDLQVIHGEVDRLEARIHNFLQFARLPTPRKSDCDFREVIAQAVNLVKARARQQNVAIEVHQPDQAVPGHVDCGQLCTVLVNLFINALDAMPSGGRLSMYVQRPLADQVTLTVRDTGAGIPPEMADRLFTPFATTKATGTGLGLSISKRIVEEHGGRLTRDLDGGPGACFSVRLPTQPLEKGHANTAGY